MCDGEVVLEVPLDADRRSAAFSAGRPVRDSGWCHLRAEGAPAERFPMDVTYVQAFTNPVWLLVGDRPIRDATAAEYALGWIDRLQGMADVWPGWRSGRERAHVFAQFDEAREVYRRFARESASARPPRSGEGAVCGRARRYATVSLGSPNLSPGARMVSLTVNERRYDLDIEPEMPLLWAIRDVIGLTGTKFGCGIAQCGACTVHLDGVPIRSCTTPASRAVGRRITTIEGLSPDGTHPLQVAWVAEQVPQCGYCQSGQLMSAAALLARTPRPNDQEIDAAMTGNVCRCGTYQRIRAAIHRAAEGA